MIVFLLFEITHFGLSAKQLQIIAYQYQNSGPPEWVCMEYSAGTLFISIPESMILLNRV